MAEAPGHVTGVRTFRVPAPPLSEWVACLWYVDEPPPAARTERVLPDGAVQMIFSLRSSGFRVYDQDGRAVTRAMSGAIATGPSARFAIVDTHDTAATVGASFHSGCAAPFVGVPPSAFTDLDMDLDAAWGHRDTDRLHTRLVEAPTPDAALACLEAALLARASFNLQPHPSVRHALEQFGRTAHTASIARVREDVGLSHRRFIEVFERSVGLAPKRYCRVRRFQRVVRLAHPDDRICWSEVAVACGYGDQSHLVRDFRAFAGITPTAYTASRTPHRNHVRQ